MKRKYIILLVIISVLFIVAAGMGAYAFLLPNTEINELVINSTVSSPLSFTTSGGSNLDIIVSFDNMSDGKIGDTAMNSTDVLTITLETDGLAGICCSYDLNWVWNSGSYAYTKTSSTNNEYTIGITATGKYLVSPGNYQTFNYSNSIYSEAQIPNYNSSSLINKLTTAHICNNDNTLSSSVMQNLNITTKIYNLAENQDHLKNANLSGKVTISNVNCY